MGLKEDVFELARSVPRDPEQSSLPPGIDDTVIDSFVGRTGLPVPHPLREWLRFTNGPRIGPGCVFGIATPDAWTNIETYYTENMYPTWLTKGWIPIAGDGCGDYYVVSVCSEGFGNPVLFLDQSSELLIPEYVVASDLWHFLRFYLGRELGERGWPFRREFVLSLDPELAHYANAPLPWDENS